MAHTASGAIAASHPFARDLAATIKERTELQAGIRLSESKEQAAKEVERLKQVATFRAARTAADTNSVTQKPRGAYSARVNRWRWV
jgi:hypothetical protein